MKLLLYICIGGLFFSMASCKKYLDEKPLKSVVIPTTLQDVQSLLDYPTLTSNGPALIELVADNYYITTSDWQSLSSSSSSAPLTLNYIWESNATPYSPSWNNSYQFSIFYSNIVLDHLPKIKITTQEESNSFKSIKGTALFYRAFTFHELAQLYCPPYSSSASTDLGLVLRLTSNVNEQSFRSTVQETYDKIIADLKEAVALLPKTTTYPTRPTKAAAYGLLARTYLSMRDYVNAGIYSDLSLQEYNILKNYNNQLPVGNPPFKTFNEEVIYHNTLSSVVLTQNTRAKIDSLLYKSYDVNDLRRTLFFRPNAGINSGTFGFRGSYHGNSNIGLVFDGITTSEMYLIRAECYARGGNKDAAIADLNTLMINRWSNNGSWIPFSAESADEAKNKILVERRKELVFRGLRWSDLQRLNLEGADITLKRIIAGITYTLPPNDKRWVMLIPWDVINMSGIEQNSR